MQAKRLIQLASLAAAATLTLAACERREEVPEPTVQGGTGSTGTAPDSGGVATPGTGVTGTPSDPSATGTAGTGTSADPAATPGATGSSTDPAATSGGSAGAMSEQERLEQQRRLQQGSGAGTGTGTGTGTTQ